MRVAGSRPQGPVGQVSRGLGARAPRAWGPAPVSKGPNNYLASRPKIRGILLGVPRIRIIVLWGLYWGPCILGNYHPICVWEPQENYRLNTWANLVSCLKACGSRLREAAQAASTVADAASAGEAPRSGLSSYSGPPSLYITVGS